MSEKTTLSDGQRLGIQFRNLQFDARTLDEESRTVELTISSNTPYDRWFGKEVLDHTKGCIMDERLRDGAPLLFNHDRSQHLGRIISHSTDGQRLTVKAKFSQSALGKEKMQDVKDGILRESSIGYIVHKYEVDEDEETYTATKWEPLEGSLVTIPADSTVGVGRESETGCAVTISKKGIDSETIPHNNRPTASIIMPDEPTKTGSQKTEEQIRTELRGEFEAEQTRQNDVRATCERFKVENELRDTFLRDKKPVAELFKIIAERSVDPNRPTVTPNQKVGMTEKDLSQYRLVRGIRELTRTGRVQGFEKELSDQVCKQIGKDTAGFRIPHDVMEFSAREAMQRTLFTNVFTAAGALVAPASPQGQSMIELLRNKMRVVEMGARVISGLVGNCPIPSQTGGGTAYWLPENGTITASDQAVGQVTLTPHRLGAATAYSLQLLAQEAYDIESFVREDLMKVLALAKDKAALVGRGVAGEPLGLANMSGLSTSVTLANAGTITYTEALRFEVNVANNNVDEENLGFLTTPTVRAGTKATAEISAANSIPVWRDNMVNGYKARTSLQGTTDAAGTAVAKTVFFGNWNDLLIGDWAGNEIIVDPYSLSLQGLVRIVMQQLTDVAVRHAVSFSLSTN